MSPDEGGGFRVRYLGCASFTRGAAPRGLGALQRPLLDVYTGARRRGESHRSLHPLAQRLDVLDYGLVVAQPDDAVDELVVTKVLTPVANAVLWAAVRFHSRALKRKVLGAAFVPIACSEGAVEPEAYLRLGAKHRFLVSLSHPPVFACILRRVSSPRTFECHAFACASAEETLALGARLGQVRRRCDLPPAPTGLRHPSSLLLLDSEDYATPSEATLPPRHSYADEEESNSYASLQNGKALPRRPGVLKAQQPASYGEPLVGGGERRRRTAMMLAHSERCANPSRPSSASSSSALPWRPEQNSEDEDSNVTPRHLSRGVEEKSHRDGWTMTERCAATETLARTIDLSSESSSSISGSTTSSARQQRSRPAVKYTYFGFETFRPPPTDTARHHQSAEPTMEARKDSQISPAQKGVIVGNGTGRVTISVPYTRRTLARGVRGFRGDGHVGDWSTLSQGSDTSGCCPAPSTTSSSSVAIPRGSRVSRHRPRRGQPKAIRWSSEDRLPRGRAFFFSLKRLGLHSLTRAKRKTGKFISSVRTKLMGSSKRSAEGSEDSAYDTSEVCLSPTGRGGQAARRQQSWSFHDLRTRRRPPSPTRGTRRSPSSPSLPRRKGRSFSPRRTPSTSSSSDSGVVEYLSDGGGGGGGGVGKDRHRARPRNRVTRVQVHHGMGADTFQRWSSTNIQDELGYIP